MLKKVGMWVASVAAAVIIGSSFGTMSAKADEINLIGLTDDLIRLYISNNNELDVLGSAFTVDAGDTFDTFTTSDNKTYLLAQFAYVNVTSGYANVRSGPGTNTDKVGRLYAGSIAYATDSVIGADGQRWTKIESGNVEGYVLESFLVFGQDGIDKADKRNATYCRVTSTSLKLRASASTSSSIKHVIPAYSELKILEKVSGGAWYKVSYTDTIGQTWTGYVSTDYVTKGYYYAITNKRVEEIESKTLMANAVWPFPGEYNIYSDYGYRIHPIYKDYRLHKGLDIGGTEGATLVSILDGTVTSAGWDSSSGNYVVITYADGFTAKYLHCKKLYVKTGQYVTAGQAVAACGKTGDATGSHLHFSLFQNNVMIDPLDYFAAYQGSFKWHCTKNK